MKKIIFRKILFDFNKFFLITIISASAIIWVFQAVNFLDIIVEDGRNYTIYLKYTFLSLPKITSEILPFALFFSFSYVLTRYELDNELLIFWSHGINKIKIINFLLITSFLIMILQIFLTTLVVPKFQNLSRQLIKNSDTNYFENFLKPKKFIDIISGLTFFIDETSENGIYKNIYIKKDTGKNKFQTTFAKNGRFVKKGNKRILVLNEGKTLSGNGKDLRIINFSKSDFTLTQAETGVIKIYKLQENSTMDLIRCFKILRIKENQKDINKQYNFHNCTYANYENINKILYKRLIKPFYIPFLILISMTLLIKSKENINFNKYRSYVFLIGLIIILFSETTVKFIGENLTINLLFSVLPIFLLIVMYSTYLYLYKTKTLKY